MKTKSNKNDQIQFILDNPHFSYETLELKDKLTKLESIIKEKELELDILRTQKKEFLLTGIPPDITILNKDQKDNEEYNSKYRIIRTDPSSSRLDKVQIQEKKKSYFFGGEYWHVVSTPYYNDAFDTINEAEIFLNKLKAEKVIKYL